MKRFVLSALAFSMVSATTVSGMAAPMVAPAAARQHNVVQVDWKKNDHRYDRRHVKKKVVRKKVVVRKWRRGEHYRDWRRHEAVRDWRRHGLHRPGRGQEWIRVGNDYLLVGIASGIIGALVAAY
jgi:Ni/Co efflux regulator RcnB